LLINFKSVLLHWVPDPESRVARLHAEPPLSGLRLPTEVPLQAGPCNDVRSSLKADFSDPNEWKFRGAYPAECGERIWPVAYTDPAAYATRAIQGMWKTTGGQLSGQVRTGTVIAQARPIVYAQSPPLAEIVRDINKYSNNLMAEQLFLTLGMQAGGVGQMQTARQRVQNWWDLHVGVPGLGVDNGSGLSRTARVSAQGLAQLLQHVWASPYMPELLASLPIQGTDGTLRRVQSEARAHLKTGSLNNVLGVAGYVDGPRGQRWVLVAIIQHPGAPNGRAVLQSLAEWTASQQAHQP
jgi:D-alanyl-D-alanine carboxypeptidase/D-alanyl-D-alanine-endopeptidase (penicillin-binding protein 4)